MTSTADRRIDEPSADGGPKVTPSQVRASRLLDAWVAGDRRRLTYELKSCYRGDSPLTGKDEREDLLLCLVRQMMDEPDLFAPRSAKLHLGVWVDLLTHLADPALLS